MQQATTVQVVPTVTCATPTFQESQQVHVVAAQQEESGTSDDEVVVTATKTVTSTAIAGMTPEVQAQLEKDKRAVYS